MRLIYDSASPENIPSGVLALVYVGGNYAWPESEIKRMSRVYHLTEQPGQPELMKQARGLAVELNAGTVHDAIASCHARHKFGHDDFTVYTSLSPGSDRDHQPGMAGIIRALRSEAPGLPFRVHVADWDNNPRNQPEVDGVKAWAKQYAGNVHGGAYDLSILYGKDDLVRP